MMGRYIAYCRPVITFIFLCSRPI